MKTKRRFLALAFLLSTLNPQLSTSVYAATTIDAASKYAYGANMGWMDWTGDAAHGAVMGEYVCSGYIYSANVGWINFGSGSPANGIQYQNDSASDFGVNLDGLGSLSGYAWGANIGWITFEQTYGAPKINMITGQMSGYVWSANCGWISLSNAFAYVQTDRIQQGALAPNGLPIAWLLSNFGTTSVNANADPTAKGVTIAQDYLDGTDPNNANSIFRITAESFSSGGTSAALTWNSVATRYYYILKATALNPPVWTDSGLGLIPPAGLATVASFSDTAATKRFYRVEAVRPLVAVQTPGAPLLTITYVSNQAIISWPPSVTGWTLQTNVNLATGAWGNYLGPIVNNSVTNAPLTGELFFRLGNP